MCPRRADRNISEPVKIIFQPASRSSNAPVSPGKYRPGRAATPPPSGGRTLLDMAIRASAAILISGALLLLAGCASAPKNADLYAEDGAAPADIYRSWDLYNALQED